MRRVQDTEHADALLPSESGGFGAQAGIRGGPLCSLSGGLGQFIGSGLPTDTKPFYFSSQTFFSANGGTLSSVTAAYSPSIQYSYSYTAAVPEPEIYAMMLAGLSVLGFVARRKHKKSLAA